ncbi:Nucleobase-ascorbate transporter LPE1 [Zea mays]|uniref:Nucleobase-ascorbate transporter LPE1 n=1 Tax=Zea mays TaxID=4577 RepID=A0A317Y399_MAIZE|nr:Nucleobase-ascorbate transporter LPE1 [Zea mays]
MQAEKAIVIQTILFLSGINTLLQVHFGTRLPAVMNGSYTYIYPAVAIILSPRYALLIDPLEVTKCIEVGLPALVLLVIFAEYASHVFAKGSFVFSRCAVLVTVVII